MANQQPAGQETLGEAMNRTELFLEKHGRTMSYAILALFVLAGLIFGYRATIVAPRAEKAAELMAEAQRRFESQTPDWAAGTSPEAAVQRGGNTTHHQFRPAPWPITTRRAR